MAKDASLRAFKCPSCGAPLEPEAGTLTMKCPYCGGTVIIPESLRTPAPSSGSSFGEAFQFSLNGIDLNQIVGNAMRLPEAISLAKEGKIDQAAEIYSQVTGMEHSDAVAAVKAMAAGYAVALTPGRAGVNWQQVGNVYAPPSVEVSGSSLTTNASRGCGPVFIVLLVASILIILGLVVGIFAFFGNSNPLSSLSFAHKTLSFGGEGIGAGLFQDPRLLGLDDSGNIIVADYQDGRVQTFDPNGKFLSTFSIGGKTYVSGMAVSRDGKIYIAHNQKIFVYDQGGNELGQIGDDQHDYGDVVLGADGETLYAIANDETIVRFQPDGTIDLEIPDTFSNATGDSELDAHLAVDGLGDMYIVGSFNYVVLKYSPEGKFINRFGSKGDGAGKFTSPLDIAVDGYGRIYVSDFFGILVFDSDGAYLNTIDIDQGVAYGLAFDTQNDLYAVTNENQVIKYNIQKPQGQ